MERQFKFDYDAGNDDFFLYDPTVKSKASVEMEDLVIDFTSSGRVSALEFMNASKLFMELDCNGQRVTSDMLLGIKSCSVELSDTGNFIVLKLAITFNTNQKILAPLIVPTIRRPSPALIGI